MKGTMQFQLGKLKAEIAGGPYREKPEMYFGVKMAEEIKLPCLVDIPTRDFSVPDVNVFKNGLIRGIQAMNLGLPLYVGCMGGIGRTGLYMAGLAKVMSEYRKRMHRPGHDPVLYVREQYMGHAVETRQQEMYIETLDVSDIVNWWYVTQRVQDGTHDFMTSGTEPLPEREPDEFTDDKYLVGDEPVTVLTDEEETLLDEMLEESPQPQRIFGDSTVGTMAMLDRHEDRIEQLQGCVLELDRRLTMQEAAREKTLRELAQRNRRAPWWRFWG